MKLIDFMAFFKLNISNQKEMFRVVGFSRPIKPKVLKQVD
jgi:hypothetical protein